jgi:hypothetical protein
MGRLLANMAMSSTVIKPINGQLLELLVLSLTGIRFRLSQNLKIPYPVSHPRL